MSFDAGLLGTFYALRHDLGFYRVISVTKSYEWNFTRNESVPSEALVAGLKAALAVTIDRLPALQFSILQDSTKAVEAVFKRHAVISFDDVLRFSKSEHKPASQDPPSQQHQPLALQLEHIHCEGLDRPESVPAWRLVILRHDAPWSEPLTSLTKIDVIFAFQHGIADGLSGVAFHKVYTEALLEQINLPTPSSLPETIEFDREVGPPASLEKVARHADEIDGKAILSSVPLDTLPQRLDLLKQMGASSPHQAQSDFVRIRVLHIPEDQLQQALQACRKHSIKLTGLLHATIVKFLAQHIDAQTSTLVAITPYNYRPFTGASNDDIVNHVSYSSTTFSRNLLQSFHTLTSQSSPDHQPQTQLRPDRELDLIKQTAREFTTTHQSEVTHDGPPRLLTAAASSFTTLLASPSLPTNLESLLTAPSPSPSSSSSNLQTLTYELSNMVAERTPTPPSSSSSPLSTNLHSSALTFAQCDTSPTSLLGVNCVTYGRGPLVVTVTWQEGKAPLGKLADGLVAALAARFASVAELLDVAV